MISCQKIRIGFFQLRDFSIHRFEVARRFAAIVIKLFDIGAIDRTFAIDGKTTGMGIVGQGIQRAGKGLVITKGTTGGAKKFAIIFYTKATKSGRFDMG